MSQPELSQWEDGLSYTDSAKKNFVKKSKKKPTHFGEKEKLLQYFDWNFYVFFIIGRGSGHHEAAFEPFSGTNQK